MEELWRIKNKFVLVETRIDKSFFSSILLSMNIFTHKEAVSAAQLHEFARTHARYYAGQQDCQAATVALLIEALILAGGAGFLKPTEE